MMQFIMIPAIFGIITLGIYKLFELYARRRERLLIIEKLDPAQLPAFDLARLHNSDVRALFSSNALTIGCLLMGLGIGILVGVVLWLYAYTNDLWIKEAFVGSSVLFFGGLGLIISVVVGRRMQRRRSEE